MRGASLSALAPHLPHELGDVHPVGVGFLVDRVNASVPEPEETLTGMLPPAVGKMTEYVVRAVNGTICQFRRNEDAIPASPRGPGLAGNHG
jgi:hypothetical protein